ncbi:cadherin-like domain-containing protein, partial [Mycolicibacterium vinylchloridicum]|uniref:cadherin-like domain-containing protein n=1 Tax=Mycolicibacterium vinylchloridicum TaxID=2736928 RepID=UPI0015CD98FF
AELARERSIADINMSVGWVPGVGTAINAMSLASDFLDFTLAALRGDAADMRDEIGDMVIDVVGMIPVVGGPLAATIHRATVPVVPQPNHAPNAVDDSFTTNENTQLTGNVLTNDTDPDGDTLTAAVDTAPSHGGLTLNTNGSFTYTPAENYYGTDTFSYIVTDGEGGTAVGTATITVNYVAPPPVVDQQHPYTIDATDPDTGQISGHFNVTHDKPVTYHVTTAPEPALGAFELDETTGAWTFTPNPRTRVLAGYFDPNSAAAVKLTFAVTVTDGTASTAPIVVDEHIGGADRAEFALPAGTTPIWSFVDSRTGDAYVFGYTGNIWGTPDEQSFSYIAAIVHADGTYGTPAGNQSVGMVYQTLTIGETTYLMTATGDWDAGYVTRISEIRPEGLTPVGGPIPGLDLQALGDSSLPAFIVAGEVTYLITTNTKSQTTYLTALGTDGSLQTTSISGSLTKQPITVGDTTYLLTVSGDYETGYETHIAALSPDGVTSYAVPVPGRGYRDPIIVGETAYIVTETGDYESGYETHVAALGPGGVTPAMSISGAVERDPIVIGETTYLITQTGDYQSGYETHVMALGPDGATPAMSISGAVERDPIVVDDATYLLMTPYSRIVTHVLALTPTGAIPVGSIPGVLSGDPVTVGGTTYLLSNTGDSDSATWQTWSTTLTPTLGGITLVGEPIPGHLSANGHPIVLGDTTYVITETWNSSVGYQSYLTALGEDGLATVGAGVLGFVAFDPVVVVGDTTYLTTRVAYYYVADWTYAYTRTLLSAIEPGGLTPGPDPIPGYPSSDPIVIGDTTYLVMEEHDPPTGYRTYLMAVTPDGVTPAGDPIPGRVASDTDFPVITVGDTTYLVTQTGDHDTGYQTHLTGLSPDGVIPASSPIPGRVNSANDFRLIAVGDTTYLVTQTGDDDTGYQTHLTALGPDGVTPTAVVIPGRADDINGHTFPLIVVGESTYLVTQTGGYDTVKSYFTALGPAGVIGPSDPIPGEVGWWPGEPMDDSVFVVGDTTYVVVVEMVEYAENSYTNGNAHLMALTPTGVVQVGDDALPGGDTSVTTVGGTTYLVMVAGDADSGYQTYLLAMTPEDPTPAVNAFPGLSFLPNPIVGIGDTTYVLTTGGMWAIDVDGGDASNL